MLVLVLVIPALLAALLSRLSLGAGGRKTALVMGTSGASSLLCAALVLTAGAEAQGFVLPGGLLLSLQADGAARVFALTCCALWPLVTLYALEYFGRSEGQRRYFSLSLLLLSPSLGMALSGSFLSMFLFYQVLSFISWVLIPRSGDKQVKTAVSKQLHYLLAGLLMSLAGLVLYSLEGGDGLFRLGGQPLGGGDAGRLRFAFLLCFLGFGVNAAVFPLQGWLPAATAGPTPLTALVHEMLLVSSGAFAILRSAHYLFGPALLTQSYAQWLPLALASLTIVYGSAMAIREEHLKRRLAWSTSSNISYILFGLMLLSPQGLAGALQHLVFHAVMKVTLFLAVGTMISKAHDRRVRDLSGLGRYLPRTMGVFLLGALSLTGLPPLMGFLSKWTLAQAAIADHGPLAFVGLGALLVSAIMTCIYLLVPVLISFWGPRRDEASVIETVYWPMRTTLTVLSLAILALSFFSRPLSEYIARAARGLV